MLTGVVSVLVVVMLAPPGGWALTDDEIAQFQVRDVVEGNTGIRGSVNLTMLTRDIRLQSNGIPDHDTGTFPGDHNPNELQEQNHVDSFRKNPEDDDEPTCLPMGQIAYAKNGVPLFNPYNALGENAVEGPSREIFDLCEGHPDERGTYHYHHNPACVHEEIRDEFIGVALDGYPIYGWTDSNGNNLTSSDLDDCHGRMENGQYRYRLTKDFPYILGCFKGKVSEETAQRQQGRCYFAGPDIPEIPGMENSTSSLHTSFPALFSLVFLCLINRDELIL